MTQMTNITDQLPYELCNGVVATVDGLYLYHPASAVVSTFKNIILNFGFDADGEGRVYWTWEDAARHFRYKSGEAFCSSTAALPSGNMRGAVILHRAVNMPSMRDEDTLAEDFDLLHWTVTYFCVPDAPKTPHDSFRVLYQCIKEFGDG